MKWPKIIYSLLLNIRKVNNSYLSYLTREKLIANIKNKLSPDYIKKPTINIMIVNFKVTVLGDVWLLGNHRLMCGDSTSIDAVNTLMDGQKADMVFTDPPYGVSASGARSQVAKDKSIKKIENDDLRGDELHKFIYDALSIIPAKTGGAFYVCYDQKTQIEFLTAINRG